MRVKRPADQTVVIKMNGLCFCVSSVIRESVLYPYVNSSLPASWRPQNAPGFFLYEGRNLSAVTRWLKYVHQVAQCLRDSSSATKFPPLSICFQVTKRKCVTSHHAVCFYIVQQVKKISVLFCFGFLKALITECVFMCSFSGIIYPLIYTWPNHLIAWPERLKLLSCFCVFLIAFYSYGHLTAT
jgi:hypothetical protein